ncbi:hypothetical protein [Helicobacter jaachi]|uniref:hypothetical protein n=1 Tax=Helicobacter jaachi TaxID=1677920 RepID=UPI000AD77470|nr:hypothetical protein [Helicobacter jaachi]
MPKISHTHSSAHTHEQTQKIMQFLHIFVASLQQATQKYQIDALIDELNAIKHSDIALICASKEGADLVQEIICLVRDKIFHLFSQGDICNVKYLNILLFALDSKQDTRFSVFINMAQKGLFAPQASDVENLLFIELYVLAKALAQMCDVQALMREYISLIMLIDINLPQALEHTSFIVERFEALGVQMHTLLEAIKAQSQAQVYFAYPAMRRRSILNWQLHCFWNVSHFFNHHAWLELYEIWRALFYTMLENGGVEGIDEAMYMQFFMYHMCGNNFQHQAQWARFCNEIDKVGAEYYERFALEQNIYGCAMPSSEAKSTKKRIAILRDRLVANSPYKVEYSLLSNLLQDEAFTQMYEVRIYTMKLLEKSIDDVHIIKLYEDLGVKVIDVISPFNAKGFYNSHLQKALALKNAIQNDNIHILISPNNGYGISDFILASRSAPLQIYYSHGNFVYDLSCIDVKMTHICQNKRRIMHEGYEFYGVPVKMLDRFYNPPLDSVLKERIAQARKAFGKECIIIGSIGRLVKLHSHAYWKCVIDIMQDYPQSIYVACGGGNSTLISTCIMECFTDKASGEAFLERVHFMGYVDSSVYGHIIDIWLDSFPLEQGESRIEYAAKGGLSLMMSKTPKELRLGNLKDALDKWQALPHSDGSPKTQTEYDETYALLAEYSPYFLAFSEADYITKGKALVELFATHDTQRIQILKNAAAKGRQIGDDIKSSEGVVAFKDIMALSTFTESTPSTPPMLPDSIP